MKDKKGSVTECAGGKITNKAMQSEHYGVKNASKFGTTPSGKKSGEYKGSKKNSQNYG